jgi:hypothetical protein
MAKGYKGNGNVWLNSWRLGVIDTVGERLLQVLKDAVKEISAETGTALMVVENALVVIQNKAQKTEDAGLKTHKLRSVGRRYSGGSSNSAYGIGRNDGHRVSLSNMNKLS